MTVDDTADEASEPPPTFDLSSPATGRFRRARSIEAAAIAGVAYSVLTVVALIRLSRFPDLSVGEAELTAWYDDDARQVWLIGALSLKLVEKRFRIVIINQYETFARRQRFELLKDKRMTLHRGQGADIEYGFVAHVSFPPSRSSML